VNVIGPFSQILTMDQLPLNGPVSDDSLLIMKDAGVVIKNGIIIEIDQFSILSSRNKNVIPLSEPMVAIPGLIDAHTHLCFAGSREKDYAARLCGLSYQEIAKRGGGILDTVFKTRNTSQEDLLIQLLHRLKKQQKQGITTCEIKSGYGLTIDDELKILRTIKSAATKQPIELIPTCLAAHVIPPEYSVAEEYLQLVIDKLLPRIKKEKLSERIDIFIEEGAFSPEAAIKFLFKAKKKGFDVCVHANQFSSGGVNVAAAVHAQSADHLEVLSKEECFQLKENKVAAIILPGASFGLGIPYAPARLLLDEGVSVVIASDWNPGSAPMGQLLTQAAVLGAYEKLTIAETIAGLTYRAAAALNLKDRGILQKGMRADLALFPCKDYREILYYQGSLLPSSLVIEGELYSNSLQEDEYDRKV
jgi:imidazolonepropionase